MILGNLYRQKGQVGRAINVHQALLQRSDLTRLEHAYVLLCLGLDFRHAGFVDRALEAFQDVVRLDPRNRYALVNLQKLHEDQHQWAEAARTREQIAGIDTRTRHEDDLILAFLRSQIGAAQSRAGERSAAARTFRDAIDIDARAAPAYLSLGDVQLQQGNAAGAIESWEALVQQLPERAYLAFERLERAYAAADSSAPAATPMRTRFIALCERLILENPKDWRARLALARHYAAGGEHRQAFNMLLQALPNNPHGLSVHQEIWHALISLGLEPALVHRYVDAAREAVFYLDPHICTRCRYRSTELLWQCPQCHEWNTFVEERMAPAAPVSVPEA
jgi:lipopolysaccharide biosynthesis regulator YciM